jgi:hypothetical protein
VDFFATSAAVNVCESKKHTTNTTFNTDASVMDDRSVNNYAQREHRANMLNQWQKQQVLKSEEKRIETLVRNVHQIMQLSPNHVPDVGGGGNPMRGHTNQLVFSRITGHPDIPGAEHWVDTNECWICNKWQKKTFSACNLDALPDKEFQSIMKLTETVYRRLQKRKEEEEHKPMEIFDEALRSDVSGDLTESETGADTDQQSEKKTVRNPAVMGNKQERFEFVDDVEESEGETMA